MIVFNTFVEFVLRKVITIFAPITLAVKLYPNFSKRVIGENPKTQKTLFSQLY
jgi:hypothetical protein